MYIVGIYMNYCTELKSLSFVCFVGSLSNKQPIKAVIFDMGGVIVPSPIGIFRGIVCLNC